jgi:hypothetical protein
LISWDNNGTDILQFTVCTTEEIINSPDTLTLFLQKVSQKVKFCMYSKIDWNQVFGISNHAYIAAAVMISFSGVGAMIALTFANVRGKVQNT